MSGREAAFGANLKKARKDRGWSQERLAAEAGAGSKGYISELEAGTRPIPPGATLNKLATALGVDVGDLVRGNRGTVPLVGYVGAGSVAHNYATADEGLDEVDAPEDATENTIAREIRGTSLGPALDRWLVYYDDVRSPVTPDLYNQLCVVGTEDQVLVKVLKPAGAPNRFHLISNGAEEPIFDREVLWAARVKSMRPR